MASFQEPSKKLQEDEYTVMLSWINNIPFRKPNTTVNWSVCVSCWGNNGDFCLSLVGSNPRPCLPIGATEMEGRGHRECFVFHSAGSLLSCPQRDHLPSQLIAMFVLHICLCSEMIFVIKLRLSGISRIPGWWHCASLFLGLWLFPLENVACRKHCSCFLVCLGHEMKNRMSLADVLPTTIESRSAVYWRTHKMREQPLPSSLGNHNGN